MPASGLLPRSIPSRGAAAIRPISRGAAATDPLRLGADAAAFEALLGSLGHAGDARLRRALTKLRPKFDAGLAAHANSQTCSLCGTWPLNQQLLLCDGRPGAPECTEEWCFACAGVEAIPDGDWRCVGCVDC